VEKMRGDMSCEEKRGDSRRGEQTGRDFTCCKVKEFQQRPE